MCRRLSEALRRVSTGWVTLAALAVFLLFAALVLPGQASQTQAETGGSGSPDTSLFYTPADLYSLAEAYGPEGRQAYIRARWTFDVAWPLVYTVFLVTAVGWLGGRAFAVDSPWQRANVVPLLAALFDFLENASTSLVMAHYPARTPVVDTLAPVFTLVKWMLVVASFVLLLVAAVGAIWRWTRRRD